MSLVAVDDSLNKVFIPETNKFSATMYNKLQAKIKKMSIKSKLTQLKSDMPIVNQIDTFVEESDIMLPQELNNLSIVFGGDLLHLMSKLSYNVGQKFVGHRQLVAVCLDAIEFKTPIFKGDLINMSAQVVQSYQTSFDIKVNLQIYSNQTCLIKNIQEMGYFTMVTLDNECLPTKCPNLKINK